MQYLLLIKVPDDVQKEVSLIQEKYDFKKTKLEPHITLLPPFTSRISENDLLARLRSITFQPFDIFIDGIGFFESNRVVYLAANESPELQRLYHLLIDELIEDIDKVGSGILNCDQLDVHVTITKHLNPERFNQVFDDLRTYDYRYSFPVSEFWLYRLDESKQDAAWIPVKSITAG